MITLLFTFIALWSPPPADAARLATCGQVCRAGLIPLDGKVGPAEVCTACAPLLPLCPALAVCGAVDEGAFQACADFLLAAAPPLADADARRDWLAARMHARFSTQGETPATLGDPGMPFELRQAALQAGLAAGTLTESSVQAAMAARCLALKMVPLGGPRFGRP